MAKIKLDNALYDRVVKCAGIVGYATPEEFIIHVLERECAKLEEIEDDPRVEERLRGLGYIE
jgi:hypothetical protein